ncbi:flagellar filament capping protein FliD [Helicobacter sp. WB40]|uniref:flagellar filament capping protein FliD n=1 Tax=Helicobacter sp. WB40 TaxID=3004130 RepID=UPI0022EBB23D|nr:flagellar filament capping protein FliD [Helicobacter sp. WB40]MDA3967811.1 flagellar filament capping protein FliD [Helicobacter sp. WB40]
MALGSLASLGVGSGVLTWDTINQMKELDIKNQLTPIQTKLQSNLQQQTELTSLMSLMSSLNSNFRALSDYSTFQKRQASVEGSGVKATAGEGLAVQDIKLNVSQLAQNDVNQVGLKFKERDSVFSNDNTTINFYHNGTEYNIDVKAGATLSDVAQSITDATGGEVLGVIMKTGGDEPYQLMIQSKNTGKDNKIYFGTTLEGAAMPGGHIKSGNLKIEIGGHTLDIDMSQINSKLGNTSEQNASAVMEAINKELEKPDNSELKKKIDSGEITIDLNKDGKGLMLNDAKGGPIKITTENIKVQSAEGVSDTDTDLGFSKKEAGSRDLVVGSPVSTNTGLSGVFTLNGEKFDLGEILKDSNGKDNAQKIADAINAKTDSTKIKAEVRDGKLVLNSTDGSSIRVAAEGADDDAKSKVLSSIGLSSGNYTSSQSFLEKMDITSIQNAQNAIFTYNGIKVERDKNVVDDVISGLTLELTNVTKEDEEVTVRISRDDKAVLDEAKAFVENYNALILKIQELTKYDEETKVAGVFNGNSEVRSITRELNSLINSTDADKNSLVKFGITMNENGTLSIDSSKFETAFKEDPDKAIEFFRGGTVKVNGVDTEKEGVFTKLKSTMDSLISGSNSTLKILEQNLINEQKSLREDLTSTQAYIDSRYEIMAAKWSVYDTMIAKTNQAGNAVANMINQMNNSN